MSLATLVLFIVTVLVFGYLLVALLFAEKL
jgi:K+-transporting ATPase KdpF subunit